MENRLNVSNHILDLSYRLISHYDAKTNQLLSIIGFDFLILGVVFTCLFTAYPSLKQQVQIAIVVLAFLNLIFIIISVLFIRAALIPHVDTVVKLVKPKYGLTYFRDITRNLGEDEYVKVFLGVSTPTISQYYQVDDKQAFEKCIIEDNARDIYAHAEILNIKTFNVKKAFNWVTASTILLVISLFCLAIIFILP